MMNETFDIFVSAEKEIRFPAFCPVCLKECDCKYDVKANPDGFFGYHKWLLGKTNKYSIPLHNECYKQIKNSLLYRNFLLLGAATIFIPVAIWLDLSKWMSLIGLILAVGPIIIWQTLNPPPIEIVKDGDEINFTVSDEKYANDLATLNGVALE